MGSDCMGCQEYVKADQSFSGRVPGGNSSFVGNVGATRMIHGNGQEATKRLDAERQI